MYSKPLVERYGSFREVTQNGSVWCWFTPCGGITPDLGGGTNPGEGSGDESGVYDRS